MPKILIIDDEQDLVMVMTKRFNFAGYEVVAHYDGKGAIEAVREHMPDLILLDIRLPNVNGIQLYEMLQEEEKLAPIPVIFLSAGSADEFKLGKHPNKNGFIGKPFDPQELLKKVKSAIEAAAAKRR